MPLNSRWESAVRSVLWVGKSDLGLSGASDLGVGWNEIGLWISGVDSSNVESLPSFSGSVPCSGLERSLEGRSSLALWEASVWLGLLRHYSMPG